MSQNELLPCPFCGGAPDVYTIEGHTHTLATLMPDYEGGTFIECGCGVAIAVAADKTAAEMWNRRIEAAQAVAPGGVLVPCEPTPAMLDAANAAYAHDAWFVPERIYAAMLEANRKQPAAEEFVCCGEDGVFGCCGQYVKPASIAMIAAAPASGAKGQCCEHAGTFLCACGKFTLIEKSAASSEVVERVCMECGTSYPDGKACPTNHDAEQEQAGEDYLRKFEKDNARFVEALPRKLTGQDHARRLREADAVAFWRDCYERMAYQLYRKMGKDSIRARECAKDDLQSRDYESTALLRRAARVEVTDAMVDRFCRSYWRNGWPFKPDNEANRELSQEMREQVRRGLTRALEPRE